MAREFKEQSIIRSVRLSVTLDKTLQDIALYEDMPISRVIQRLLDVAVNEYLHENPDLYKKIELGETRTYPIIKAQSILNLINEHSGLNLEAVPVEQHNNQ